MPTPLSGSSTWIGTFWRTLRTRWLQRILTSLAIALIVGLASLHSRSITLQGVRWVDHHLIVRLLKTSIRDDFDEGAQRRLQEALEGLKTNVREHAYVGVAVWRDDVQLASNHVLLDEANWSSIEETAKEDPRYLLEVIPSDTDVADWRIGFFRPDRGHNMSAWNFLLLPFQQWADPWSMEVQGETFLRKWNPLVPAAFLLVFLLQWIVESLFAVREGRAAALSGRLRRQLEASRASAAEAQEREVLAQSQAEAARRLAGSSAGDRASAEDLFEEAAQKEQGLVMETKRREAAEAKVARLEKRVKREARRADRPPPTAILRALSRAVTWTERAFADAEKLLGQLSHAHRQRLWRMVLALGDADGPQRMQPQGFRMTAMAGVDLHEVFHEKGRAPFKLYVVWLDGAPTVIAAIVNDAEHETDAYVERLRKRWQQYKRRLERAA